MIAGSILSNADSNARTFSSGGANVNWFDNIFNDVGFDLRVKKLDERAVLPTKAHVGDLGYDLYCLEQTVLYPGVVTKVRTGIACGFPYGYGALIRDRSSVATKNEVFVVAGVIDSTYTNEIIVAFYNPGRVDVDAKRMFGSDEISDVGIVYDGPMIFEAGQKIAQMILTKVHDVAVVEVNDLEHKDRGLSGFGSSGKF